MIEELSGSVLLSDASGSQNAIEELSGSMLMPDLSGPVPAMTMKHDDELTGSFLVDAGSTGALPSVESTGQILAAKAAMRAPFAADSVPANNHTSPDQTGTVPKVIVPMDEPSDLAATVVRPPPSVVVSAPMQIGVAPVAAAPPPNAEPFMVPPPRIAPEQPAKTTMIGVPAPPELAALQQAANAPLPQYPLPAPSSPSNARLVSDALPALPQPERSTARLHDFRAISPDPRVKFLVPGLALLGALVLLGVIGLVVGAVRKKPSGRSAAESPSTTASASSSSRATARHPRRPRSATAPIATAALGAACTLGGVAHVIAPRAVVQSGVEADIVAGHLAIGFATRERDGIAVEVDPTSLAATKTVRAHLHSPRRDPPARPGGERRRRSRRGGGRGSARAICSSDGAPSRRRRPSISASAAAAWRGRRVARAKWT